MRTLAGFFGLALIMYVLRTEGWPLPDALALTSGVAIVTVAWGSNR